MLPLSTAEGLGPPAWDRGSDRSCPVGLGVLTGEISPGLVDEVIELAGCREKRRRLLPARTVVYFVLGLCLFSGADSMGPPGYRLSTDAQVDDGDVIDGEDAGAGKSPAGGVPAGLWCAWWRFGGQSAVTSAAAVRAADSSTMALRLA
jgi:hypothetical protein